jgi:hypothetical protein
VCLAQPGRSSPLSYRISVGVPPSKHTRIRLSIPRKSSIAPADHLRLQCHLHGRLRLETARAVKETICDWDRFAFRKRRPHFEEVLREPGTPTVTIDNAHVGNHLTLIAHPRELSAIGQATCRSDTLPYLRRIRPDGALEPSGRRIGLKSRGLRHPASAGRSYSNRTLSAAGADDEPPDRQHPSPQTSGRRCPVPESPPRCHGSLRFRSSTTVLDLECIPTGAVETGR